MKNRTGETSERRSVRGHIAEQKLEGRNAHAQAVRRGLLENRREIRRAIKADDSFHVGTLVYVATDVSFQFVVAVRNTNEGRQMRPGGVASNDNLFHVQFPFAAMRTKKTNRCFDVVDLRREFRFG